jgi:hypothetical protein
MVFRLVLISWYFPVAVTILFYVVTRFFLTALESAGFWWQIGLLGACWVMSLWLWMILGMTVFGVFDTDEPS